VIAVVNLNQWFAPGDESYIIVTSAMVVVMIPGLGFLYPGLARRKFALTMIWVCMASFSIITFQWYFWGYPLAFSAQGKSGFIGDLTHFGLMHTLGAPSPRSPPLIPELLYVVCFLHGKPTDGDASNIRILMTSRCNSVLPRLPLLAELLLSAAAFL